MGSGYRRDIKGGRKVITDGVKEHLHSLILKCGTAEHGDKSQCDGTLADGLLYILLRYWFLPQILFHKPIHLLCNTLNHFLSQPCRLRKVFFRYVNDLIIFGGVFLCLRVFEQPRLHSYKVYTANEVSLLTNGHLYRDCLCAELFLYICNHTEEIGASPVELVHETEFGHFIFVCLPPHGL